MYEDFVVPDRLHAAQFVTAMGDMTYPGYPDPSTESGWAEVPAVMLLVDFTGREDVVYTAMINEAPVWSDDGGLAITSPRSDGSCVYLFALEFDGVEPLEIAGIATQEAIRMFAGADMLLIASADQEHEDGAPIHAIAPNDPHRWRALLASEAS